MLYKNIWDLSIALWENICFQNRNNKCLTYKIEWDILYPTKGNQMTIETIKKEWEDLEDIDLAEFVLKAYLEGNICGGHLAHFINDNVYYENGSLYTSSTKVMKDFLEEHYEK